MICNIMEETRLPGAVSQPMEDDLKILKVEYLSNRFLDHTQFLNLDLGNQRKR